MGEIADCMGATLADGAVAATVLLGLAALAMVASAQPARRLVIGRSAVVGALLVLPISVLGLAPRLGLVRWLARLAPPNLPLGDFGLGAGPQPWRIGLAGLAAAGLATGLGILALGSLAARRWTSRTIEPSPESLSVYESLPLGRWRGRPRLRVSARVRSPVVVGSIRPTILVPPDLDEPEGADSLRLGLLHELAHLERRDPAFGLVGAVASALWFFVPPLWWVKRQMRLDQEFLADRRASARYGMKSSYASSLVGLHESRSEAEAGSEPTAGGRVSQLVQRVLMLVRCPYPVEERAPRGWSLGCVLIFAVGTVLASGLTLRLPPVPVCGPSPPRPHGSFRVARLMIESRSAKPGQEAPPYALPRALPARFEMVVDVWADPKDLPKIAVAGRRLGPFPADEGGRPPLAGFHKVRIVRDHRGLALWVDGRLIPPGPRDDPPPSHLTLEPAPGLIGRFLNLFLTY